MNKKRIFDIEKLLAIEEPCPPQFAPGFDERARRRYLLDTDDFWLVVQAITIETGRGLQTVADALRDVVLLDDIDHGKRMQEIDLPCSFSPPVHYMPWLARFHCVQGYICHSVWWLNELHPYVKQFRRDYLRRAQ